MPNPIFDNPKQDRQSSGGIFGFIFDRMYNSNPAFRDFVNSNRGKSIDDICRERGIDPQQVKGMSENDMAQFFSKNGLL